MKKHYPSHLLSKLSKPFTHRILNGSHRTRVVILHEDKILLVRGRLGSQRWSLPGGGIKKGETPEAGAVREVQEELHITLQTDNLKLFKEGRFDKTAKLHFYFVAFEVNVVRPDFARDKKEILEAAWFPVEAMPPELSDLTRIILQDYTPAA